MIDSNQFGVKKMFCDIAGKQVDQKNMRSHYDELTSVCMFFERM